jgi:CDP-diacylglycerol--serine O-phosphatidyltransferase
MYYPKLIIQAFLLIMPVVIAGTLHMLAVKKDIFPQTKIPICSSKLGRNKTVRGVILMPVFTVFGTSLLYLINTFLPLSLQLSLGFRQSFQLGVLLGIAYVLFELPNSFFKRKLGIPPGKSPDRFKLFFRLLDRLDSTLGCLLVFYFFLKVDAVTLGVLMVMGIVIHAATTNTLYLLRIRAERW